MTHSCYRVTYYDDASMEWKEYGTELTWKEATDRAVYWQEKTKLRVMIIKQTEVTIWDSANPHESGGSEYRR